MSQSLYELLGPYLDADGMEKLLLLWPFGGQINLQILPFYAKALREHPQYREVQYAEILSAIRTLIAPGMMVEYGIPNWFTMVDDLLAAVEAACEPGTRALFDRAFCKAYVAYAESWAGLMISTDPIDHRLVTSIVGIESERLRRAVAIGESIGMDVTILRRALTFT